LLSKREKKIDNLEVKKKGKDNNKKTNIYFFDEGLNSSPLFFHILS